jgi:ketosteroid isomerase-like protein
VGAGNRAENCWLAALAVSLTLYLPSADIPAGTAMDQSSQAAIVQSIDRFRNAFNSGNQDEIARYYTDDMVKIRQGSPSEGKSDVIRRLMDTFREFNGHLDVANDEIVVNGTMAFTRGTFVVSLTPKAGGDSRVFRRRFLEIWRIQNGAWRVSRSMDNSAD